jgi:2-amino-4-hydroxy-6-hydroxymethyldihydropteridine diphosphokinase
MNQTYLLIGGNLGNREENLGRSRVHIATDIGKILRSSSIFETEAWGKQDQPPFLNQVLLIETNSTVTNVLHQLLTIEERMGRKRMEKFGPRLIDIDILFFNNDIIHEPGLTVPHPHLHERRFTLEPLNEIAPLMIHPVLKKTITELLESCPDPLAVKKL